MGNPKSRSNGNGRQRFHIVSKFGIRLDRVAVVQTLNTPMWHYEIFARSYFICFTVFLYASLDTHSHQSLVIQLLAAIISLLIIPLIVVSQVAVVFSGGSRLMQFNNRGSPAPKLNVSMIFVRCRCTKIWNWFEHIQYIPTIMIILLFVVHAVVLEPFDFTTMLQDKYTRTGVLFDCRCNNFGILELLSIPSIFLTVFQISVCVP